MMDIEIFEVSGKPITGCCKIEFKGFTISLSNVFPHAGDRILVTDEEGKDICACFTLEEAIQAIEAALKFRLLAPI